MAQKTSSAEHRPERAAGREQAGDAARYDRGSSSKERDPWRRASQVALIGLFIMALIWSAQVSSPVLVPLLLAWVIATVVLPIVDMLHERKVPRALAAFLVTGALVATIVALFILLSTPTAYWLARATELGALLKTKFQMLSQPLAVLDDVRKTISSITSGEQGVLKVEQGSGSVVSAVLGVVTPAVSEFLLFVGALLFYLVYQDKIRTTAVMLLTDRDTRLKALRTLNDVDANMATYFTTFALVNLCLGAVTCALAYLSNLPNPLLWGVLAAVLNFVPYIGPAIVAFTLGVVGLVAFPTLGEAVVPPLVFIAIVAVEGNFITPALMGRRLELNPFAIFIAIAFCTWLWGPIGAFLAVPLLMALKVSFEQAFAVEKPDLPA